MPAAVEIAPETDLRLRNTYRLIPSRFPSVGILDRIAEPEDLAFVIELEAWTNDRVSNELGTLHRIPEAEWVTGHPFATVIMAAFCHPHPAGGRFNGPERGAWYAGFTLETAHAEIVYHRTAELAEIGIFETYVQQRAYLADFRAPFHDIRSGFAAYHSAESCAESRKAAEALLEAGSNGIVYRSVRHPGGECIACFRPPLVANVRQGPYFEYRWSGTRTPTIRKLPHDEKLVISKTIARRSAS